MTVKTDRCLIWPTLASVGAVSVAAFIDGLPGLLSFIAIPISLLGGAVTVVCLVVAILIFVGRKRFRRAGSLFVALIAPFLLLSPINWIADCAHLGLTVGYGVGQLTSDSNESGFADYDWSVGLAGGPVTFLIRDEADEIGLPMARHKHPSSSENGFGEMCVDKVRHLIGHYYVCTF